MIGNIEIFFAENPNTPTRTTKNTSYVERKSNWEKRVSKAIEQSKIPLNLIVKCLCIQMNFLIFY